MNSTPLPPALVIGAGGHARTVLSVMQECGYEVGGILDASQEEQETIMGVPLAGPIYHFVRFLDTHCFHIAIGSNYRRKHLFQLITRKGGNIVPLIHPQAHIDQQSSLGKGCLAANGCTICPDVTIGSNVIINTRCLIEHGCRIDDHCHIAPNSSLAGHVHLGEGAFVGINATVKDDITIGKWAVVGAGAVVVSDVPDGAVVVGNPARISGYNKPHPTYHTDVIVDPSAQLGDTLERIDFSGNGYAIVANSQHQLLGILTDGILRRAQIHRVPLDTPVKEIMEKEFVSLTTDKESEANAFFDERIKFIPVIDNRGRLIKVLRSPVIDSIDHSHRSTSSRRITEIHKAIDQKMESYSGSYIHTFQDAIDQLVGTPAPLLCASVKNVLNCMIPAPINISTIGEVPSEVLQIASEDIIVRSAVDSQTTAVAMSQSDYSHSDFADTSCLLVLFSSQLIPLPYTLPSQWVRIITMSNNDEVNAAGACMLQFSPELLPSHLSKITSIHQLQAAHGIPDLKGLTQSRLYIANVLSRLHDQFGNCDWSQPNRKLLVGTVKENCLTTAQRVVDTLTTAGCTTETCPDSVTSTIHLHLPLPSDFLQVMHE